MTTEGQTDMEAQPMKALPFVSFVRSIWGAYFSWAAIGLSLKKPSVLPMSGSEQ